MVDDSLKIPKIDYDWNSKAWHTYRRPPLHFKLEYCKELHLSATGPHQCIRKGTNHLHYCSCGATW